MERKTNWIAIAVCVVGGMAIGFLWYGFLFFDQWMAGNGFTLEGEKMFKNGVEVPMSSTPMIFNTVAMVVYALIINWLVGRLGITTWMEGAKVGGAIGLIMLIGVFIGNQFASNPMSLTVVDGSYSFVLYTMMGAIIGGWPKR